MSDFCYIEPGGMTTLTASKSEDGGVYVEASAAHWDADTMVLAHLPPVEARALAAWLLEQYGMTTSLPQPLSPGEKP